MRPLSNFSGIFYFDTTLAEKDSKSSNDPGVYSFENGYLFAHSPSVEITPEYVILADISKKNLTFLQNHFADANGSQATLIRRAFTAWGDRLPNHLSGEFIIIIWERQTKELRVIRDRFGCTPFYYTFTPDAFISFSDRIGAIPYFKKTRESIDPLKIKHYLTPPSSYQSFDDRTFYHQVKSALPGHVLYTQGDRITHRVYWKIDPAQYRHQPDSEYFERFRALFFASVEERSQGYRHIGTHLSGGIDSSSIACVTNHFHSSLSTFHINPGLPSTDESFFVDSVVKKIHSRHFMVSPQPNIYEAMCRLTALFDRPEHFVTPSTFHFAAAEQAKAIGCDLILTGHDGDSVVDNGNGLLETYRKTKNWSGLRWALEAYATTRDLPLLDSNWLTLSAEEKGKRYKEYYFNKELWKILKKRSVFPFFQMAKTVKHEFGFSYTAFMRFALDNFWERFRRPPLGSLLTAKAQQYVPDKTDVLDSDALYSGIETEFLPQFKAITNQFYVDATEQLYHIGLHYGHRYSHPFFDEKLVELSLAIPEKLKFGDGKGRDSIRQALKGVLPEEVRTRGFKTSFSEYGLLTFTQLYEQTKELFPQNHLLWTWVDHAKFLTMKSILLDPKIPLYYKSKYLNLANRVLYLGIWFESLNDEKQ